MDYNDKELAHGKAIVEALEAVVKATQAAIDDGVDMDSILPLVEPVLDKIEELERLSAERFAER